MDASPACVSRRAVDDRAGCRAHGRSAGVRPSSDRRLRLSPRSSSFKSCSAPQRFVLQNAPFSVVLHWGVAMAFIAALSAMAVFAAALPATARRFSRYLALAPARLLLALCSTATLAFVTMCIGAYVSSSGAGLACLSIPDCAGNVIVRTPGQYAQMLHRAAAAATLDPRRRNARARVGGPGLASACAQRLRRHGLDLPCRSCSACSTSRCACR